MPLSLRTIHRTGGLTRLADTVGAPVAPPVGPTLQALTLSPTAATVGQAFTATISGRTAGSTLSLSGAGAAGLSISGTTVSGTPTTAGPVNLVETLAGATNSPRTSTGVMTVAAAPVAPTLGALAVSPSSTTVGTAYSGAISGRTSGSMLSLAGAGAAGLSISGTTITGTPTTSGPVDLVETLSSATNSPRTSSGVAIVAYPADRTLLLGKDGALLLGADSAFLSAQAA